MTNEELNTALYEKMFSEQETYRAWLLAQPPEEILNHTYEYRAGRYSDVSGIQQPAEHTGAGVAEIPQSPCRCVCGMGGPGDKLYGGNLADCHRPSQRGDTEVPERTKRAITVKTGWESQAVSLHSRSKRQ